MKGKNCIALENGDGRDSGSFIINETVSVLLTDLYPLILGHLHTDTSSEESVRVLVIIVLSFGKQRTSVLEPELFLKLGPRGDKCEYNTVSPACDQPTHLSCADDAVAPPLLRLHELTLRITMAAADCACPSDRPREYLEYLLFTSREFCAHAPKSSLSLELHGRTHFCMENILVRSPHT